MDLCSENGQIREGCFLVGRRSRRGGGSGTKGRYEVCEMELALVDELDETGTLMAKLDQV